MQNTKFSYFGLHLKKAIFKPKTFTFWKRLSLSQAEISRKNKKILYLVFCRQKKHFRSYNLKKNGPGHASPVSLRSCSSRALPATRNPRYWFCSYNRLSSCLLNSWTPLWTPVNAGAIPENYFGQRFPTSESELPMQLWGTRSREAPARVQMHNPGKVH